MATGRDQRVKPRQGRLRGLPEEGGETHATDGSDRGRRALDKKEGEKSKSSIFGWISNLWSPTSQILASHMSLDEYESEVDEFDNHWSHSVMYARVITAPTAPVMDFERLMHSTAHAPATLQSGEDTQTAAAAVDADAIASMEPTTETEAATQ